jgi:hypothetical protein
MAFNVFLYRHTLLLFEFTKVINELGLVFIGIDDKIDISDLFDKLIEPVGISIVICKHL